MGTENMMLEKKTWRKIAKARVAAIDPVERRHRSELICQTLIQDERVRNARRILLFSPLPDEIDITPLVQAMACTHLIYLPVVDGEDLLIKPYDPANLQVGSYNILEPQGEETLDPADLDLIIVPAVAFATNGIRLGRGKGFYDRLLQKTEAATIGIGFIEQYYVSLPQEAHDQKMDSIVVM